MMENLFHDFNVLVNRPKNRQLCETRRNQRKIASRENFSAKLSPETGDSFPLATAPGSVQP
jgi:hypothetical protein